MEQIALFPGSFDPFTLGHLDIVNRGLELVDRIIIGIGENSRKNYMFSLNQRKKYISDIFKSNQRVEIKSYSGLTMDFCRNHEIRFLLRGLRNTTDFDFEKTIHESNKSLNKNIETILLFSNPSFAHIQSNIVRELILNQADISAFVPIDLQYLKNL